MKSIISAIIDSVNISNLTTSSRFSFQSLLKIFFKERSGFLKNLPMSFEILSIFDNQSNVKWLVLVLWFSSDTPSILKNVYLKSMNTQKGLLPSNKFVNLYSTRVTESKLIKGRVRLIMAWWLSKIASGIKQFINFLFLDSRHSFDKQSLPQQLKMRVRKIKKVKIVAFFWITTCMKISRVCILMKVQSDVKSMKWPLLWWRSLSYFRPDKKLGSFNNEDGNEDATKQKVSFCILVHFLAVLSKTTTWKKIGFSRKRDRPEGKLVFLFSFFRPVHRNLVPGYNFQVKQIEIIVKELK